MCHAAALSEGMAAAAALALLLRMPLALAEFFHETVAAYHQVMTVPNTLAACLAQQVAALPAVLEVHVHPETQAVPVDIGIAPYLFFAQQTADVVGMGLGLAHP